MNDKAMQFAIELRDLLGKHSAGIVIYNGVAEFRTPVDDNRSRFTDTQIRDELNFSTVDCLVGQFAQDTGETDDFPS